MMPKITQIQRDNKTQRVIVYIDYRYCASIRPNIWEEMSLQEGSEISCAKLHQKEASIWRNSNKRTDVVYSLKHAINRTVAWFNRYLPNLEAIIFDSRFGYDSSKLSLDYPNAGSVQDIGVFIKGTDIELMTIKVATNGIRGGTSYWISMNKITKAQSNPKRDIWVVLYYKYPMEKFIWIKPSVEKKYKYEELIKGSKNHFVFFDDKSAEVHSFKEFCDYIKDKIDKFSGVGSTNTSDL
jgi:hypothetical protein